ncbi:hypothetical protein [Dyella sp.]|uniref:hypothetical protein n=1 Tax=Dyella sp. TaxID=1869338 RepID=UPI002ED026E8
MFPYLSSTYATPTYRVEHALLHVRHGLDLCDYCLRHAPIQAVDTDQALDSLLINALRLADIHQRYEPGLDALRRSLDVLRQLLRDAVLLREMRQELMEGEPTPMDGCLNE